jgi:Amt family ammonium transporter
MLGTGLLWIGWFGFNAGSALSSGLGAVSATASTQVCVCVCVILGLCYGGMVVVSFL